MASERSRDRRHHDFDLNIRLRRTDGRPMSRSEAHAAFRYVREHAAVPVGYLLAAINWRRPHSGTGWREGSLKDLAAFRDPMYVHADDEASVNVQPATGGLDNDAWEFGRVWRMGSVKR